MTGTGLKSGISGYWIDSRLLNDNEKDLEILKRIGTLSKCLKNNIHNQEFKSFALFCLTNNRPLPPYFCAMLKTYWLLLSMLSIFLLSCGPGTEPKPENQPPAIPQISYSILTSHPHDT